MGHDPRAGGGGSDLLLQVPGFDAGGRSEGGGFHGRGHQADHPRSQASGSQAGEGQPTRLPAGHTHGRGHLESGPPPDVYIQDIILLGRCPL